VFGLSRVVPSLSILTGEDVRVSTPVSNAPLEENPGMRRSNAGSASRIVSKTQLGRQVLRLPNRTPG
jgi:hypothetical protein